MRYGYIQKSTWIVFRNFFQRMLPLVTGEKPEDIMRRAKVKYRAILADIPEFDRNDRFLKNILSAAILASIYLNLPEKPSLDVMTKYYREAMNGCFALRLLLRSSKQFTEKSQAKLAKQAEESQLYNNPYSWKFRYEAGADINSYSAYFDTCGILRLFRDLGIPELTPAMCVYDYDMAALGGSEFFRKQMLAGGGDCCDCHYRKK